MALRVHHHLLHYSSHPSLSSSSSSPCGSAALRTRPPSGRRHRVALPSLSSSRPARRSAPRLPAISACALDLTEENVRLVLADARTEASARYPQCHAASPLLKISILNCRIFCLICPSSLLQLAQLFDTSVGITGEVDLAELDGPFVKLRLKGRFWHKRSTVLARLGTYLQNRIPEILEVDIEDDGQLDDSPENF